MSKSESESDIRPSMVTHTRNLCSAFNPSKVHTHSSEHTHTLWTHTRSSGQPFMLRRPGGSWGFCVLLKGTSVVVLMVESALYIHSPHLQFLPDRDSNSQPFDYESDSLSWTCNPKVVGLSLRSGRNCRWGEWITITLSTLNTTTEVRPLSKAPNPQLLPGHHWLPTAPGVCALGWVKCRAQILHLGIKYYIKVYRPNPFLYR